MPAPARDVVVIGASAGGLEALVAILPKLQPTLKACLLIVVHTGPVNVALADVLGRTSALPVAYGRTGDPLRHGRVYVARANCHLLVTPSGLAVVHGPKENGFRPAIDPLFRTAARICGARAIGVILSGGLSDGTFGLSMIKNHGGVAIVQDPDDAIIPSMPESAIEAVEVDRVLPASEIASAIETFVGLRPDAEERAMRHSEPLEPQLPEQATPVSEMESLFGSPSALTCPECGGALWEVKDGRVVRYQCHVGHQFAPDNLEAEQREQVDGALWTAVRVLEEHAELQQRTAARASAGGLTAVAQGFVDRARESRDQAAQIRAVLLALPAATDVRGMSRRRRGSARAAEERRASERKPRGRKKAAGRKRR